jgi:hypothetical protein
MRVVPVINQKILVGKREGVLRTCHTQHRLSILLGGRVVARAWFDPDAPLSNKNSYKGALLRMKKKLKRRIYYVFIQEVI